MRSQSWAARFTARCRGGNGLRLAVVACAWLALPATAHAYVGPGAGLSAIGIVLGLLAAIVLGIVGFIWYPIKRLLNLRKERAATPPEAEPGPTSKEP